VATPISQINQLAALEAAVASAATATAASPLAGLQPGDVIAARVLALLENGQVQLAIGNALIEATAQVPLPLGATVQLAVQQNGTATTLQFVGQVAPQAVAVGAVTPQGADAPLPVPAPPAVAIAVPGTNSAPNGAAAAGSPPVAPPAPASAVSAITDATALAQPPQLPLIVAPGLAPAPTADPTVALQAAVRTAAATQGSLAPLFAEIAAAVNLPALPEPIEREALRLLSLRPPLDGNLTAQDVRQAFANSGLFLEANLAESAQTSPDASAPAGTSAAPTTGAGTAAVPAGAPPQGDLKAALIVFRQVLATALAGGEGAPTFAAAGTATTTPLTPPPTPPAALQAPPASASSPPAVRVSSPPPPFGGGPTAAQPPTIATIDGATAPHEAVKTLIAATDGALSRQTLLQAASLPSQPGGAGHIDNAGPRWLFEVPFATPQGTNVAQFEISRDGKAAKPEEGIGAVWRARFSIDVEPIGPVHAQIALRGARTAVTLWAENPESAARLRAGAAKLTDALRAADLDPGEPVVREGAPRSRAMPAGHFLDRAS
jgi:hypothetical protein